MHIYCYWISFIYYDERRIWIIMKLVSSQRKFEVKIARNFFSRAFGLLFKKKLSDKECLLITPCKSIHTIGMRYNIDVVFIDAFGYITDIYYDVSPFKVLSASKEACSVIEFLGGELKNEELKLNELFFIK